MARALAFVALLSLACFASGCVTYSAGIASASRPLAPDGYDVLSETDGTSWGVNILGIPFCQANTKEALDEALANKGADALIQVTTDNRTYYLLLAYLQRVKVEGLAVRKKAK